MTNRLKTSVKLNENSKFVNFDNNKRIKVMRVGITFSTFDLLHSGHIAMLRDAKGQCDYLIAGIQYDPTIDRPDSKNVPVQTMFERYQQLAAVKYVDEIIPYATEQDLVDILESIKVDVRILGVEYKEDEFTGKDVCQKRGIELFFNKRDHRFSTSSLRERVIKAEQDKVKK